MKYLRALLDEAEKSTDPRDGELTEPTKEGKEPASPLDFRQLYYEAAETVRDDCWALDPAWLLDHPEFYEQIRTLDDQLTTMERIGAGRQLEYEATLAWLVTCVRDAKAAYERERKETGERAVQ